MIAVSLRCSLEFKSAIVLMISAIPPPRSMIRSNVSVCINGGGERKGGEDDEGG